MKINSILSRQSSFHEDIHRKCKAAKAILEGKPIPQGACQNCDVPNDLQKALQHKYIQKQDLKDISEFDALVIGAKVMIKDQTGSNQDFNDPDLHREATYNMELSIEMTKDSFSAFMKLFGL